jgi:uncharacterized protein YneR
MKIHISNDAANWYKNEMHLKSGDCIRFFARYGGHSTIQQGYSLGIAVENPHDIAVKEEKCGITYYIEDKDLWYFDEQDLYVDYNATLNEPEFRCSRCSK